MELVETTVPKTSYGQEHGEWAKLLDSVDPKARNGHDFSGEWLHRGSPTDILSGAVMLECAGYRTNRDKEAGRKRLFVLWQFRETSWIEIGRSDERDWALKLRVTAARALEG